MKWLRNQTYLLGSIKNIFNLSVLVFMSVACTSGYDVCIYGGSSAAVTAAYSAAQMGKEVIVVSPDERIGGLTTSGLGYTDIGNKQAVFGVAKQFYRKLGEHYGRLESWIFEPSVALDVMEGYLDYPKITVLKGYRLEDVRMGGAEIKSMTAVNDEGTGVKVSASYFIDATYEGDLMAKSGVSYHVGREDNSVYGEDWNGVQLLDRHQFPDGIVQNVDAVQIRGIMETDPYLDGTQADVIIDDSSSLVAVSEGWRQTNGRRGYGSTYYELKGDCTDAFVEYTIPDTLSGMWDVYCFQQLKDKTNPVMHYEIRIGKETYQKTFDRSEMKLVGQVSGEWFHLGEFELETGVSSVVSMSSDKCELPLRADALMLVKK